MSLLADKHARYFRMCLQSLPQSAQAEDANKLALVYFCLHGLDLLGKLPPNDVAAAEYIYTHLIPETPVVGGAETPQFQAFRASNTFRLAAPNNDYDLPNLSATFFALAALLALREDFRPRIDRHRVMRFVAQCQRTHGPEKGSFAPVLGPDGAPFGDADLRLCYLAAGVRRMLGYDSLLPLQRRHDVDVAALHAFVLDKVNYTGGMASYAHAESHLGLTFCGLAALALTGYDFAAAAWTRPTIDWLVHRQVDVGDDTYEYHDTRDAGGFNGRENKFADTCYAWWVLALLEIVAASAGGVHLASGPRAAGYLLERTQHKLVGGFGKDPDAFPDPFHLFLGLASISLMKADECLADLDGASELGGIDHELVISQQLREFMDQLWLKQES